MTEASLPVQRTLRAPIGCTGVGLHSGRKVSLTLRPGAEGSGIVVVRTGLPGGPAAIPARWDHVVDTRRSTVLGLPDRPDAQVGTVEHVLAALAGSGIDNAVIEVDGPEMPVMDGSAAPFVFLIECAGIAAQDAPRRAIEVLRPVRVEEGDASVTLLPDASPWFGLEMEIEFASAAIRRQSRALRLAPGVFKTELARARTFGFAEEIEALREAGLARGGSLANAVVLRGATVLNAGGLRYADEFVRHKTLDAVGDLALAGAPFIGCYRSYRGGHRMNAHALKALLSDPAAYEVVETSAPRPRAGQRELIAVNAPEFSPWSA